MSLLLRPKHGSKEILYSQFILVRKNCSWLTERNFPTFVLISQIIYELESSSFGYGEARMPKINDLEAKPFWDVVSQPDVFPWAEKLESNAHIIVEELQSKLDREEMEENKMFAGDSAWQNKVMGSGWSAFRLQRLGVWNVENCKEFPKTYELIRSLDIPIAVRGVCFARQAAGSGVKPHSDGRNFILTSHLGLKIPKGCWLSCGGERQSWNVGKLTTLDTSFDHSTGNPTEFDRHVLIIDFGILASP